MDYEAVLRLKNVEKLKVITNMTVKLRRGVSKFTAPSPSSKN